MRKTIEVKKLRDMANGMLASEISQPEKRSICSLIENVLMDTGNYKGYNHNYWMEKGYRQWVDDGKPDFPEKEFYIYGPNKDEYGRTYF